MIKNSITALIISVFPIVNYAQQKQAENVKEQAFKITVNTKAIPSNMIYLTYHLSKMDKTDIEIKDSVQVVDNIAEISGKVPYPVYAQISNEDRSFGGMFWIENSNIYINAISGGAPQVIGSKTEDEYGLFSKETKINEVRKQVNELNERIRKARDLDDETESNRLSKEKEKLVSNWDSIADQFVYNYPSSFFSLNRVYNRLVLDKYSYDKIKKLYDALDPSVKYAQQAKVIENSMEILKSLLPGKPFPPYNHPNLSGKDVYISDFKGKYVLLTFTGTWVPEYRADNKVKSMLYTEYYTKGLAIIDVAFDGKIEAINKMISEDHANWIILSDFKGWHKNDALRKYEISTIPTSFLLGPDGIIIATNLHGKDLETKIRSLIK